MSKSNIYLEQAEFLYLKNNTLSHIATILPVSIQSLSKWKEKYHWEEKRKKHNRQPLAMADKISEIMEKKVNEIVAAEGKMTGEQADALAKLSAIRKTLGSTEDYASMVVMVTEKLAKFAQDYIRDEDARALFFETLSAYYAEVKEHNYG